jgi:para-nitrobenzyl esterase
MTDSESHPVSELQLSPLCPLDAGRHGSQLARPSAAAYRDKTKERTPRHSGFTRLRRLSASALCCAVLVACGGDGDDTPRVRTDAGELQGVATDTLHKYLGIPYAAPPVGALRWQPPAAPAPWSGTRDASAFASHCAQLPGYFGVESHTEDCLYLNVFAPKEAGPHPVMVWLHGGGLHHGQSNDFDPTRLVQQGVVVVTLNYRVGAFGFMAHPALTAESPDQASGNYGLMDQQAALQWVRRNIQGFGGDPGNVTLFGQSAGGLSVMAQLASPAAAGLFHKAIIQSGYQLDLPTLAMGESFGTSVGSAAGCTEQTADCLRGLSTDQILQFQFASYVPVVDGRVLPQSLRTAYAAGAVHKVPVIQGSTADEYTLLSAAAFDLKPPPAGFGPITTDNYAAIQSFYLGGKSVAEVDAVYPLASYAAPADAIDAMAGDLIVACPGRTSAQLLSAQVPAVYAYEFDDPNAPMPFLPPVRAHWGAFHAGDLRYLFELSNVQQAPVPFTTAQQALADQMVGFWTRFARTGNPNPAGSSLWPAYTPANDSYLSLQPGGQSAVTTQFAAQHHCAFWTGS